MLQKIKHLLHKESTSGVLLVISALLAMLVANTSLYPTYAEVLKTYIGGISVGHWINDGFMAVFFLLIGLEVKRELKIGALKSKETAIFPAIAAVGGMLVPALVYLVFNSSEPLAAKGWAIPAATDIAFALGILGLLGKRVPISLKVFLLALAIIDDLGVIIIIALFYSGDLNTTALFISGALTALLFIMNYKNVVQTRWYLLVGLVLWFFVYKSGIHATLAGVIVGFSVPLRGHKKKRCPLKSLEHALHPYVVFLILPLFAFANAGIPLSGVSIGTLGQSVPLGSALGLMIGKPLGVFIFSFLAIKFGIAKLPKSVTLTHIFGVSILCGIGFTMSIFISSLAFLGVETDFDAYARLGVLIGSTIAAVVGYFFLNVVLPKEESKEIAD